MKNINFHFAMRSPFKCRNFSNGTFLILVFVKDPFVAIVIDPIRTIIKGFSCKEILEGFPKFSFLFRTHLLL